jgi:hypothetical protein
MDSNWWAGDGFRGADGVWGGELVDQATPFAGRDKVQHVVIGALLALLLARWATLGTIPVLGVVLILSGAWEAVELLRYRHWQAAGAPPPWPFAADRMSWRDVVAALAGALLALLLL